MNAGPGLRTARLDLECVRRDHAQEVWPQSNDDRMWTYFPELRPRTVDDQRRLYEKWERGSPHDGEVWLNWICRERSSALPAGAMQATVLAQRRLAYVAYAIYPAHQRKGYAREAAGAVIAHVREAYGVERFRAEMDARNAPSYRLAEALGFVRVEAHTAAQDGRAMEAREYLYELTL